MKKVMMFILCLPLLLGGKGVGGPSTAIGLGLSSPGFSTAAGRYNLSQTPSSNPQLIFGVSLDGFVQMGVNSRSDNIGGNTYTTDEALVIEVSNMGFPTGQNSTPGDIMVLGIKTDRFIDVSSIRVLGNSIWLPDDVLISVTQPTIRTVLIEIDRHTLMVYPNINEWVWVSWNWGTDPS